MDTARLFTDDVNEWEVDQLREAVKCLRELAVTDPLTGLYNRRYMDEHQQSLMALIGRGGIESYGLIVIDLDQFKKINDRYGHQAGDELLRETAATIRMRPHDIIGRLGGDEFLVLIEYGWKSLPKIAKRIGDRLAEHGIAASVGYTTHRCYDSIESVRHRADSRMYKNKAAKRAA